MNLSTLKRYAPEARREFIQAVSERAALFGITEKHLPEISFSGDVAMIDGHAVGRTIGQQCNKLCDKIRDAGYTHTMEQVAYTWFNRLVAIRYMELHDYLDHGYRVLSARTEGDDLPEIMRYAEQVDLPGLDKERVVELKLDGSKDAELYREVLLGQCHALHRVLPFLFETVGEETELLLPENLLLSDSMVRTLVRNSPEEEWQDAEVLGWLYQFYISERKDEVMARKKAVPTDDIPAVTQLFTPHWIVRYLVENSLGRLWMLNRPGSRLRDHMPYYIEGEAETDFLKISKPEEIRICDPACGSGHMLTYAFDLLTLIYEEEGYAPTEIPALILRHNLHGLEICPRAAQLAELALVFKAREKSRRFFQPEHLVRPRIIELRDVRFAENELRDYIHALGLGDLFTQPMLRLLHQFEEAKNFGSLIQPCLDERAIADARRAIEAKDLGGQLFLRETHLKVLRVLEQAEALTQRYHVVVANPPYMGSKWMNSFLRGRLKVQYESFKADLFSAFVYRGSSLAVTGGMLGYMSPNVWMYITSHNLLRDHLVKRQTITSLIELPLSGFSGAVVQVCAFTFSNSRIADKNYASYIRLCEFNGVNEMPLRALEAIKNPECGWFFRAVSEDFSLIPGMPIAYWVSDRIRKVFNEPSSLSDWTVSDGQNKTADNAQFVRLSWEVSRPLVGRDRKWIHYAKGGAFRKWYGNFEHVVDWSDGAREHYRRDQSCRLIAKPYWYREGITWTLLTSSHQSFRLLVPDSTFDMTGSTVFIAEGKSISYILGFLNSVVTSNLTGILNPTFALQIQDVRNLPIKEFEWLAVERLVEELVSVARADWDNFETSWDFRDQPLLRPGLKGATLEASWRNWEAQSSAAIRRMQELETENNRLFIAAYGLDGELQPEVPEAQITLARAEARRDIAAFLSYAVGCMMGRYSLDHPGLILANAGDTLEHFRLKIEDCGLRMEDLSFASDEDGILPLTELPWFDDDVTERVIEFLATTFGTESLEDNLTFLADHLSPKKGESSRETIRRYLCDSFFKDHLQTYKKRPIYWLFSSGKQKAFQALVYLHRYNEGTLARMRTEYVVPLLGRIPRRIEDLDQEIDHAGSTAAQKKLEKQKATLGKQLDELRAFDEKLRHAADQRIAIDLDDGVKVNYGKFGDLLADVKKITGKKE